MRGATRRLALGAVFLQLAACGGGKPPDQPPQAAQAARATATALETSFSGYASRTYPGDHELCVAATRAALKKLGLRITGESGGMFKRSLEVESEDGTAVAVQITELTKTSTRISLKVGYLFGNRDAAERIHSEIEAEVTGRGEQAKDLQQRWKSLAFPGRPSPQGPEPEKNAEAPSTPVPR
jgi:hypothetical protein